MKDDIRKYLPDLATVLRESEPARIKAQKEQAIQRFKEAQGQEGEDAGPEASEEAAPESSPRLVRAAPSNDAPATASPWASSAPTVVPKEALPSALAPAPVKETAPATIGADAGKRRKVPRWAPAVLAVLAVVVPLAFLWFAMRPKALPLQGVVGGPAGSSFIEEGPAGSATGKGAPAAGSSSFIEEGPAPSAVPTVSATAPAPAPSDKPSSAPHATDDPYAEPPVKSAKPRPMPF